MAKSNFEKLVIYNLSEKLADEIWDIVITWKNFPMQTTGMQLVRAADSVGANIAEGAGRGSYKDNKKFIYISRGSLYETKHFLRRSFRGKLLTKSQTDSLVKIIDELLPKLNAYLKSIGTSKSTIN
ncbi:MAG TPA: four helix bundle protein [Bacteroidia bacterium]|nr:four helix bundle protein [Bacteroidia bacterium]